MSDAQSHYREGPELLIVNLAMRGDRDAFTELVRRKASWLRGLLRRLSGDETLADDLAQRVFLKMWRRIRSLKQANRFGGWIKRIAVNEWIDHQRKQAGTWDEPFDDTVQSDQAATPGAAIDLDSALAELPDAVRVCVVLAYHEQMTHPEIVTATGFPIGTVKSHIRRGSARLRARLIDYGASQ